MIRQAEEKDFDAILDMCEEFWGHTQFVEDFDRSHTLDMVALSCSHGLLVVADDGEIFGFMAAIKSPLLGSRQAWMATELAWYVKPEKRGKLVGVQLVSALERLCIKQEVKYLNLAYMQTSMPETVRKLYERMGYELQETLYTKVLIDGSSNGSSGSGGSGSLFGR